MQDASDEVERRERKIYEVKKHSRDESTNEDHHHSKRLSYASNEATLWNKKRERNDGHRFQDHSASRQRSIKSRI